MIDFRNIEYLKFGNIRQRKAYDTLLRLDIMKILRAYTPILTGTIPIAIDVPQSDLDIICECKDHAKFTNLITESFEKEKDFVVTTRTYDETKRTVCRFQSNGFDIEIFGQNIPAEQQDAYRHMIVEYKILKEKGVEFRSKIKELKSNGVKTEQAFAKLLGLKGDPYKELLNLKY
ncbi:diadenosine tetraphosphate hydrolase [Aquimarina atlantica]|uniref:Diadenosine tetraphosphate hydrolase n=1 Tax=Aquimarina atlantica TaxID=1317122 RepID=A0A023BRF2_9FLAO|nr:DUF4269 domain-containing protein [Aquimarina atlantica]EZH72570.1 diadenosine tetraphosphate hydrolase [Aquimarina atlantica]